MPSRDRADASPSGRRKQLTSKVTPAAKSSRSCAGFGRLIPDQTFSTSENVCVPAARREFDATDAGYIGSPSARWARSQQNARGHGGQQRRLHSSGLAVSRVCAEQRDGWIRRSLWGC